MTFAYRVTARLAPGDHVAPPPDVDGPICVLHETGWEIETVPQDVSWAKGTHFVVTERGFPDAGDAEARGRQVLDALRLAGLLWEIGLDFGDGWSGAYTLPNGRQFAIELTPAADNAVPMLVSHLGLHVYANRRPLQFVTLGPPLPDVIRPLTRVLGSAAARLAPARALTARQRVSCDLLHALRFERGTRARFLLGVAAIEAVLEPAVRGGLAGEVVEDLLARVAVASLPAHERQSLASSIAFLRRESISRTGARLADERLAGKRYLDMPPGKFFGRVYAARSGLVHRGDPGESLAEFESLATVTERFARDLVMAEVQHRTGEPVWPPEPRV